MKSPKREDFGIIDAKDEEDAFDKVSMKKYPKDSFFGPTKTWSRREAFRSCLIAKKIN